MFNYNQGNSDLFKIELSDQSSMSRLTNMNSEYQGK
jgi:hypothetical protein